MKYPELVMSETVGQSFLLIKTTSNMLMKHVARICDCKDFKIAERLVACWNACREFDDPAKGVEELREIDTANEALRSALRKSHEHVLVLEGDARAKHREYEMKLHEIDRLRYDLFNGAERELALKLAYDALRDWAIGKTPVCPDLHQTDKPCAQPEVNVQDGAYQSSCKIQPLTDPIEEALEVLSDLVELWKRNRAKGRSAPYVRGAILLTVADINRLTAGCQTK